jgi:hypothetical protein
MTEFDPSTFASLTPEQFGQLVKSTPDDKLKQLMQSDARGKILDGIFAKFPSLFRPERAGSTSAVIHWIITERADGGVDTYEVVVENAACTVANPPEREPRLALTMSPVDFLKVVSGAGNPMMMFMTGKLKAKGDLSVAANIVNLFDIPKG